MSSYKSFVIDGRACGSSVENIHLGLCDMAKSPYHTCEQCEKRPANDRCVLAPWVGITYRDRQPHACSTLPRKYDSYIWYLGKPLSPEEVAEHERGKAAFDQAAEEMFAARKKARHQMRKWPMSQATREYVSQ